jgi:hypothetical protein
MRLIVEEHRNERCTNWVERTDMTMMDALGENALLGWHRFRVVEAHDAGCAHEGMPVRSLHVCADTLKEAAWNGLAPEFRVCAVCEIRDVDQPGDDICSDCAGWLEEEIAEDEPVAVGFQACEVPGCTARCMQSVDGRGMCDHHAASYEALLDMQGVLTCKKCRCIVHLDDAGGLIDKTGSASCEGDGLHRTADETDAMQVANWLKWIREQRREAGA